ncbi:hypothetical protein B0H21DRAFT_819729 [Amylocystis lapponica]|nr:hypothetical protein B0H21DRAFT_819729 [Amylocystis lapponica]
MLIVYLTLSLEEEMEATFRKLGLTVLVFNHHRNVEARKRGENVTALLCKLFPVIFGINVGQDDEDQGRTLGEQAHKKWWSDVGRLVPVFSRKRQDDPMSADKRK